jgi:hypothetical protein
MYLKSIEESMRQLVKIAEALAEKQGLPPVEPPEPLQVPRTNTTW